MGTLLSCLCAGSQPPFDRLTLIYEAARELSGDDSLPSAICVSGVPPLARLSYIYAAFRVLADDDLPSQECVEGEPYPDQVTRIYEAVRIYADDDELDAVECVRGLPIWQQWIPIYEALYVAAGEPEELNTPVCVAGMPQFDVLTQIYCAMVYLVENQNPVVLSATILNGGDTLQIIFNQSVTGQDGFELDAPGAPSLTYSSGEGTATYLYTLDPPVNPGEVVTMDYDVGAVGNIVNSLGEPLLEFSDLPVTNASGGFIYLRPSGDGSLYFRPDGVSLYIRP